MAVNITPLHDRVLVRRLEEKESVKGGIIIPDTAKEKPQEGEVIAVGAGKINEKGDRIALDVKVGDTRPVRQVLRQRNQDRRRGIHDPEGRRNPREDRRRGQGGRRQKVTSGRPSGATANHLLRNPKEEREIWQSKS